MLGELTVAALHHRIVQRRLDDRGLEVVDHDPAGHSAKVLEGVLVATQPGLDLLVEDQLGVLMTAARERHHEHPGLAQLVGLRVDHPARRAEVHLRLLARRRLEADERRRPRLLQVQDVAAHGAVAAVVAVVLAQTLEHGLDLHPATAQLLDHRPVRRRLERLTRQRRLGHHLGQQPVEVTGRREGACEQPLALGQLAVLGHGLAGDAEVACDLSVLLAGSEPAHKFAHVECHESPSCHGIPSLGWGEPGGYPLWQEGPSLPLGSITSLPALHVQDQIRVTRRGPRGGSLSANMGGHLSGEHGWLPIREHGGGL